MSEPKPTLQGDDELSRVLELQWLSEEGAAAVREDWLAVWNQVPFDEVFHARCRQRLERCQPLAVGTSRHRRLDQTESCLTLVSDPSAPGEVFVSLSHAMPALLWVRAPSARGDLLEALGPYLDPERPAAVELAGHHRVVKPLDVEALSQLDDAIRALELWIDDTRWGSAFDDDPWRGVEGPLGMVDQTRLLREAAADDPDRFAAMGYRTLWSGSVLRIEQHPMGMWVFDMRYRPAQNVRVIANLNDLLGTRWPEDLPVDLAASLLRGGVIDARLLSELEAKGEAPLDRAAARCGMAPAEADTAASLAAIADEVGGDQDALATLANLASRYRHEALLFDLWERTEGTPLGDDLERFLSPEADLPEAP